MSLPTVLKHTLGVSGYTTRAYMQPGEIDVVLALLRSVAPRSMIEIGVNEGLTARSVLDNIPSIEDYIGLDVGPDYQFEIPSQEIERPDKPGKLVLDDPRFTLLVRGGNHYSDLNLNCDVMFIDGDHGRASVLRDSQWAADIVNPGGMIIWHDYGNWTVEVTEVLDSLHAGGRKIFSVANTWVAFEQR